MRQGVPAERTKLATGLLTMLRLVGSTASLTVLYFVLPMTARFTAATLVVLVVGLLAVAALIFLQALAIRHSAHPRLREIEALAVSFPLFILTFATTYYLMNENGPGTFGQPVTRLDALYFTVTVFATVGFGDLTAQTQAARAVVTVQMVGDLLFLGLAVRVLTGAARQGLQRSGNREQDRDRPQAQ